jgi:hypothetical protein
VLVEAMVRRDSSPSSSKLRGLWLRFLSVSGVHASWPPREHPRPIDSPEYLTTLVRTAMANAGATTKSTRTRKWRESASRG